MSDKGGKAVVKSRTPSVCFAFDSIRLEVVAGAGIEPATQFQRLKRATIQCKRAIFVQFCAAVWCSLVHRDFMASYFLRAGSKFYQMKLKRRGKWQTVPTTVRADSPGALRRIKKLVAEENAKELATPSTRHGWQWVPDFLARTYRDKTLLRYITAWAAIEVWCELHEVYGPEDVTFQNAKEYPHWRIAVKKEIMRPCQWNTALTELRVLSTVMQEATARGYVAANPCFRLGLKRRDVKKKPEITPDQQAEIEAELNKPETPAWMRHSWIVAMGQGFRLSETAVPIFNIDLTPRPDLPNGSIWVKGKGNKIHVAPLHAAVRVLAEKAIKEGRTVLVEFPKSPAKEWWNFFRRMGMQISFHSTRVSVITRLARGGYSKSQTMAYVGHASETVHDVYTRLGAADVAHLGSSLPVGGMQTEKTPDASPATRAPTPLLPARQA